MYPVEDEAAESHDRPDSEEEEEEEEEAEAAFAGVAEAAEHGGILTVFINSHTEQSDGSDHLNLLLSHHQRNTSSWRTHNQNHQRKRTAASMMETGHQDVLLRRKRSK